MKTLSEAALRKQFDSARSALAKIEKERGQKERAALVGKCFKFLNSYGSGDKWWLYVKITEAGDFWPSALAFQHKSDNTLEVRHRECFTSSESYTPITREEFDKARAEFTKKLILSLKP